MGHDCESSAHWHGSGPAPEQSLDAVQPQLQIRIGICFPNLQVSPLVLEASSQWDVEGARLES